MRRRINGVLYDTEMDERLEPEPTEGDGDLPEFYRTTDGRYYMESVVFQIHDGEWRDVEDRDIPAMDANFRAGGGLISLRRLRVLRPMSREQVRDWYLETFVPKQLWETTLKMERVT